MKTRADYMAHCVWLWMGDFFGDDHEQLVDIDQLITLLKEVAAPTDGEPPFENPWVHVYDELRDECECGDVPPCFSAEVMEIVEVLCGEDMALAIEILNEYKRIIAWA